MLPLIEWTRRWAELIRRAGKKGVVAIDVDAAKLDEIADHIEKLQAERDAVVRLNDILAARQRAWHEQLVSLDPIAPLRVIPDTEIGDPVAPIPVIRPEKLTALLDRLAAEERRGQMLYAENQRLRAQVELAEAIRANAIQDALAAFHKRGGGNG